ncbi:exosortase/archaeosortase family protein [Schlesneria sp. T3-172]|uniref:exosortase/archaeosortase family protein n=2 Tax=Schlesneria TaxID=656899 RepID=UPI0037C7D2C6
MESPSGFSQLGTPSAGVIVAGLLLVLALGGSDIPAWRWMYRLWMTSPDSSHGILVPCFSAWLLWHRKGMLTIPLPAVTWSALILGSALIILGTLTRCTGVYIRMISLEAAAVVPCVAGVVLICGGWHAARWAWPAVLFLVFMIPLPAGLGNILSGALQSIATVCSTFLLQTAGVPAVSEGNIIWLTEKPLGVAQACSGLRMMTSFFALAAGAAIVVQHPTWVRYMFILSAPLIAIGANVLRIFFTAVAYEFGNEKMAELIFHDLAGWLMMPVGLLMLWGEYVILSKLFQEELDESRVGARAVTA